MVPGSAGRTTLLLLAPVVLAVALVACGGGETSDQAVEEPTTAEAVATDETAAAGNAASTDEAVTDPTGDADVEPVVFADDYATSVEPIFAGECAACHLPGGPGSPHWELGTAGQLAENHMTLALVVGARVMPPWPAGGDSPAFHEDRSLSDDEVQAILDWSAAGAPIDVPADRMIEPTVELVGLADPDSVLAPPAAYAGSTDVVDDYRCQIYELPAGADGGYLTAYEFVPDQPEVVHHAIGYLLPADARERAEARDGEDGRPGWSCFGSSGLGRDETVIGWAPGQLPTRYPDGSGVPLEPGAFFVIQVHYHYEDAAPADASTLAINFAPASKDLDQINIAQLAAPAEIPCTTDEDGPLCDREVALAAAYDKYGAEGVLANNFLFLCGASVDDFAAMTDGLVNSSCDVPARAVGAVGEVVAVLGHEHEIGDWFRITINPDAADEQVLLDIPDWDFDWQYNYEPAERIVIDPSDTLRIECGWDRSRRDPDLEPSYVLWADGTNDEMCFGTVTTRPVS